MRLRMPLSASFALLLSASGLLYAQDPANLTQAEKDKQIIDVLKGTSSLWRDPGAIESLNLLHGASGPEHAPACNLVFVKEDTVGATPKFEVKDENGVHWKVKLGKEAQSETAATRLLWAAGYYVDPAYYFPEIRVEGL